jgi:ATP-dependent exoDNAse (exonuclease V) beta subunit
MADPILRRDTEMHFPHFTLLKASAGSGKTRTLTKRFAQFLLSEKVPRNRLRNMLAVTFSNNAAKEMKGRTLSWLKAIYFGKTGETAELSAIVSLSREDMGRRASLLIEEILDSYSDFQIKTIDSFMTTVFKASAIDFGYNPDFEILMNSDSLMEYSFSLFLRNVKEGASDAAYLEEIIDFLMEQKKTDASFLWDPSKALLDEVKKIYRKLASRGKKAKMEDYAEALKEAKERIAGVIEDMEKEIETSGIKRHGNSSYKTIVPLVRAESFPDLIGKGFSNPPVTRPQMASQQAAYDRIIGLWSETAALINRYAVLFARTRCMPYVRAYDAFGKTVEMAKRQQGKVFIEDINMHLAEYLSNAMVPDVYFRIGETIFHFLIDEFQDTSPIQWRNLFPLIENSLSQGGSLFAVGDTKQAIYGFRDADYTIMKRMESQNPFPSSAYEVEELDTNYRSRKRIIEFNERVFKENVAQNAAYREAGERSGLTEYIQKPKEGGGEGYAEVSILERNDEEPAEKEKIQGLLEELHRRGYRHGDIAVLTQTNEDAVRTTGWLNERDIPFVSYSSLDVRRRKITGEIVALLNFLDSPTDDFSFGTFILGDIFAKAIAGDHGDSGDRLREFCFLQRKTSPLYKAFETEFSHLWKHYFEELFRASGFLPLYDLVTEIFAVFRVFENLPEEEATLVKILEVVKEFEGAGFNSLKDFLKTATGDADGEAEWNMAVPQGIDAVQVMTIHKAKGLGFPAVIVLLYAVRNRGFEYIVEEVGETAALLKISKNIAACDRTLQSLYDQEKMSELVNRLNSLYVGFTRPERELYVVGVKNDDKEYPFDLLPAGQCPPSEKPQNESETRPYASVAPPPCPLLHRHRRLDFPAGPEEPVGVEEKRRGEFIHRVLSFVDYSEDGFETELFKIIGRVRDEMEIDHPGEEVKEVIIGLIENEETGMYFKKMPRREIMKEQEYSDASGRLFRMDRVVIDPDSITVLDYKTGKKRDAFEKYRTQMSNYMKILREVYPGKTVRGVISFIDLGEMVQME